MGVKVIIQKKGLFEKKFSLLDLIQDGMRYGTYDDFFRLDENNINGPIAVFDSQNICRGHEIFLRDNLITLTLPLPTNENDIHFFYHHIKIICAMMGTDEFTRDGKKVNINLINTFIELDKASSIDALRDMKTKIENGVYENMCIYGALNPIVIGKKQIELIGCDLQKFGDYMNKLQSIDAYYATPNIYRRSDSTLFGVYAFSDDNTFILPQNPQPILIKQKIPQFFIGFVIDDKMKGSISYNDFLQNVDQSNEYDASHFIITLSKSEITDLLENFKTEV